MNIPLVILIGLAATTARPKKDPCFEHPVRATFGRIVDGDTFKMLAHPWHGVHLNLTVRLLGVDTPEPKGLTKRAGDAATKFTSGWADTYPDVLIYDCGKGSFGRTLARVCPPGGGLCLTEALIAAKHVKVK